MVNVMRMLGLAAPVVLTGLGLWLERDEVLGIDSPEGAAIGLAAVGIATGLLLREWWAAIYAPAIVFVPLVILTLAEEAFGADGPASAERTHWIVSLLIVAIVGLPPLAIGAGIGTLIGKMIEHQGPRISESRR